MLGLIASAALAPASPQTPPPIVTVPIHRPATTVVQQQFVTWHPGDARCDGATEVSVTVRRPYNEIVWVGVATPRPVTMQFAVDESGRPLSIRQDDPVPGYRANQISPALAASRFAPGPARQNCTIVYTPKLDSFDDVPIPELASYVITQQKPRLPRPGFDRLRAGDECRRKTQPLVQVLPDFQSIAATPGVSDWALVGFDVTASGETRNAHILASTGNAELGQASVTAISKSRYNAGEARSGCSYPFSRNAGELPAPVMPDKPDAGREDQCEALDWAQGPRLVYPDLYRKRSIEGWAILKYDVAPWGAIGNVQILDAQPTQDFGNAAKAMLERAKKEAGTGATECMTRVRYEMARDEMAVAGQDDEES
ncbi:energy transducer TonB [Qipengyuania sp.]|uniref:energy transducer TonB n=1 Tax=Qipengyuania sp. TaxID=2004515 RepID=UPI0035C879E4